MNPPHGVHGHDSQHKNIVFVFLDTEFTNFVNPELLSLALVADDGREFYAERTDYDHEACSEFVQATVLPLFGRITGAACTREQFTERVRDWFQQLPAPVTVLYDFAGDRDLLTLIASGHPTSDLGPPANIAQKIQLGENTICDPVFAHAAAGAYTDQWPQHHALADARALLAGYRAWRACIEGVWT